MCACIHIDVCIYTYRCVHMCDVRIARDLLAQGLVALVAGRPISPLFLAPLSLSLSLSLSPCPILCLPLSPSLPPSLPLSLPPPSPSPLSLPPLSLCPPLTLYLCTHTNRKQGGKAKGSAHALKRSHQRQRACIDALIPKAALIPIKVCALVPHFHLNPPPPGLTAQGLRGLVWEFRANLRRGLRPCRKVERGASDT